MSTFQDFFGRTGVHSGPFRWGEEHFPAQPTQEQLIEMEREKQEPRK